MLGLVKLFLILSAGTAVVGGGTAALTLTGSPTTCVDRVVSISSDAVLSAELKWDEFKTLSRLGPTTVSFTEQEATSLAHDFITDQGQEVKDLQIIFCPLGWAEATGEYNGIDFLVRGTLDLTTSPPQVDIINIEAGNLPNFIPIADALAGFVDNAKQVNIGVTITSIIFASPTPDQVTLMGIS